MRLVSEFRLEDGGFGALLRILKPPYDVSHEKFGCAAMNFGRNQKLYFATFLRFEIVSKLEFQVVSRSTSSIRQAGRDPVGHF